VTALIETLPAPALITTVPAGLTVSGTRE
jgi:hypothetical protein